MTRNAKHQQAFRERRKLGATVPLCQCGRQLRGKLSKVRGICSACWKKTSEGKAESKAAVERHRKK